MLNLKFVRPTVPRYGLLDFKRRVFPNFQPGLGERKEWQLRLETPDGALVTTISSEDPGTYTATESEIAVSDAGGEATVRLQIDVGGTLQDLPTGGNQTVGADALSGEGTYVCSGDVLTLNVVDEGFPDGLEAVWNRVG